ncbi:hypothetical protein PG989_010213 [Apiospora arundinis]
MSVSGAELVTAGLEIVVGSATLELVVGSPKGEVAAGSAALVVTAGSTAGAGPVMAGNNPGPADRAVGVNWYVQHIGAVVRATRFLEEGLDDGHVGLAERLVFLQEHAILEPLQPLGASDVHEAIASR